MFNAKIILYNMEDSTKKYVTAENLWRNKIFFGGLHEKV